MKLERAGVNLDHFGEEIRFENDSVLLAIVGIIATRAESARKLLISDGGSFAGLYSHFLVVFFA